MLTLSPRLVAVLAVPWVWASWSDPSPSGAALRVKNGFEFVFLGVGFVFFHVRLHCEAELLVYKILHVSLCSKYSYSAFMNIMDNNVIKESTHNQHVPPKLKHPTQTHY